MTITVTSHGVQTKSASSTDVVFPSFTPAAGSMLLLIAGGGGTLTINGITGHTGGAAWTQVKDIPGWSTANRDFKAWACFVGGSPSASAVTIDINYVDTGVFELFELSGVDTSGTVTNAFGVDGSEYGYDLEPWTATLAAFSAATNMTFCVGIQVDATPTFTWDGNLTTGTLRQLGSWAQQCAWVDSEDNTVAFNSENFKNGFIWATEIKAAAGGSSSTATPTTAPASAGGLTPAIQGQTQTGATAGLVSTIGLAPSLLAERVISPTTGLVSVEVRQPALATDAGLQPAQGALSAAGLAPSLVTERVIQPGTGAFVIAGQIPALQQETESGSTVAAGTGALSAVGLAPTLLTDLVQPVDVATVSVVGYAPTLMTSGADTIRGHATTGRRWRTRYYGETSLGPQPLLETDPTPPAPLPPEPALVLASIPDEPDIATIHDRVARLENDAAKRARRRREERALLAFLERVA